HDDDAVHLGSFDEPLENRLAAGRLGERRVEVRLEIARGLDTEETALPAGVDGLEDGRKADRVQRSASLRKIADCSERRLRDGFLPERTAHSERVCHAV